MPPATKAPPAAAPLGLPGTPGRDGLNLRGGLPVAAQPQPQRAWELPTRPVPTRQAGGVTGSGVGTKPSAPAKGAAGLGAEVAKSWEKANAATEKDIAKSVDAWRQAEANIGKEGAMLRSGWYQEAKADADEAVRKAIEASAQMGVVMSPYMLGAVNTRARAVAMAGYRMKSAELAVAENAQRLQVAGGISNVYQNIQRQGLDPALAANMTQQIGAGRAARDANGRLLNDAKTENDKFLAELNKMLRPQQRGTPDPNRPGVMLMGGANGVGVPAAQARNSMDFPIPGEPMQAAPVPPLTEAQASKVMPLDNPIPPPGKFAPEDAATAPVPPKSVSSLSSVQKEAVAFLANPEVNAAFFKLPKSVQDKIKRAVEAGATVEQIRHIMGKEILFPGQNMVDELEYSSHEELYWDDQAKEQAKDMGMTKAQYLEFVARIQQKGR